MAIAAPARVRRAPAPGRQDRPRRPPLRVVTPSRRQPPRSRRPLALAMGFALSSLLAVGAAHAYLVQGQVRLANLQQQLTAAQSEENGLQVQVAELEQPSHVVTQAQHQGLAVPAQVTDLPLVAGTSTASHSSASTPATPTAPHTPTAPPTPSTSATATAGR